MQSWIEFKARSTTPNGISRRRFRSSSLRKQCILAHANSAAAKAGAATGSARHKKTSAGEAPAAVDTAREQQRGAHDGLLSVSVATKPSYGIVYDEPANAGS